MAYAIKKGSDYFNTVTYTGNGTSQSITGVGFSPDLVWVKNRNSTQDHSVYDTVRGISRRIYTNGTFTEDYNIGNGITSFDSDGWTTGNLAGVNTNTYTYASWNWRGSDSAAVTNTNGTITSQVSANPTSGFSVVTYTGNNGASGTIGHGLGVAPSVIITKARNLSAGWPTLVNTGSTIYYGLRLNSTATNDSGAGSVFYNNTPPTSTVYTVGGSDETNDNYNYVSYCFANVEGFSKIGSYTGNGSADGTFVYTGFRPALLIWRRTDASEVWQITDSKINSYNVINKRLYVAYNFDELVATRLDFVSNGFKFRDPDSDTNASGGTYIYMAFAENPFKNSLAR